MLQNRVDISFSWVYGEQKSLKENGEIMFKKIAIFIFVFAILCVNVYAHSGRTDGSGGHNSPRGYHYHHGYPEHQHPNGVCPYDDRYSDYSSEEEDNESDSSFSSRQSLDDYAKEKGIELGPVKQQDNFDEEEILLLLLDIGIVVVVIRWIYRLVKKKGK